MKTHVTLVYFNAGGGHRAAAQALQEVLALQRPSWSVTSVNLFDILDPRDRFRRLTGFSPEDLYNQRLARGWTLGLGRELRWLQTLIRLRHTQLVERLSAHWRATGPDLVVSLIPNFNRALYSSLADGRPGVPFVTVMTDMADLPPHFWIEPGQAQHLVCGTERALAQARAAGHALPRVHLTSGMMLRPSFYGRELPDRAAARRTLGLDTPAPVGLVMFGGQGSMQMLDIARDLPDRPLILVCGRNRRLAERLQALRPAAPHVVLGFVPDVAALMHAADYFIGKPGPGSLSEALHMGLPVLTYENAWTMPQERYNAQWLREGGYGIVMASLRELRPASDRLLARLPEFRARAARVDNRAIFELPEILSQVLADGASARSQVRPAAPAPAAADPGPARPRRHDAAAPVGVPTA